MEQAEESNSEQDQLVPEQSKVNESNPSTEVNEKNKLEPSMHENESAKAECVNNDGNEKSQTDNVENEKAKTINEYSKTENENSKTVEHKRVETTEEHSKYEKSKNADENNVNVPKEDTLNDEEKEKARRRERRKSREEGKEERRRRRKKRTKKEGSVEEKNEESKTATDDAVQKSESNAEEPDNKQESYTRQDTLDGSSPERTVLLGDIDNGNHVEQGEEQPKEKTDVAVEEAVLAHREQEAEAFQKLIDENVKLQSDVQKLEKKIEDLEHKGNLISLDLDTEKIKTMAQADQIKLLEHDLKMQEIAKERKGSATSSEIRTKADQAEGHAVHTTILASRVKEGQEMEMYLRHQLSEANETKEDQETKIKDLQLRLTRMTKDCEEKDKRIHAMSKELKDIGEMVVQLEKYLDNERVQKIHEEHELGHTSVKGKQPENTNVVGRNSPTKSSTCVIQ